MEGICKLFLVCLAVFFFGCASTPTTRQNDAIAQLEKDPDVVLSESEGLTSAGCIMFFVNIAPGDCYKKWHSLSLKERNEFLRREGSPIVRGLWDDAIFSSLISESMKDPNFAKLSRKEMIEIYMKLSQEVPGICRGDNRAEEDMCLFTIGRIATQSELEDARRYYAGFAQERQNAQRMDRFLRSAPFMTRPQFPSRVSVPKR